MSDWGHRARTSAACLHGTVFVPSTDDGSWWAIIAQRVHAGMFSNWEPTLILWRSGQTAPAAILPDRDYQDMHPIGLVTAAESKSTLPSLPVRAHHD